jgi:hypothetical protein
MGVRILSRLGSTDIAIVDIEAACTRGGAALRQAVAFVLARLALRWCWAARRCHKGSWIRECCTTLGKLS